MNASELRIGNYVICEQTTHIISELGENHVLSYWIKTTDIEHYVSTYDDIKPIPLTEEWLLNFGFGKIKNIYCHTNGFANSLKSRLKYVYPELCIYKTNNKTYTVSIGRNWLDRKFRVDQILKTVKYVHQLQNIYFALTGNELTIK